MGGGSFNYLCFKAESASEILEYGALEDLVSMEQYLRARGKHDAADELLKYHADLIMHKKRIEALGARLQGILHDVEWWASGDRDEKQFDIAWHEFVFGKQNAGSI